MNRSLTATLAAATAAAALASLPAGALAHGTRTVPEGNAGTTRAKVSLELELPVPHAAVTVAYHTADGTARAGSDYMPVAGTVTFGPLDTEREVSVPIIGDTQYEGDETFYLETSGSGGEEGARTVTITDDDPAPSVSVGDVNIGENGGTARFPVSLSAPSGLPTTVSFATTDGTAHAGSDYVARSGTVTFAPGETVEQVSVPVVDDAVHEDTEGFALSLSSPVGATLGTAQAQATIVDDDAAPLAPAPPAAPQIITVVRQPAATAQALTAPAALRTAYAGLLGRGAVVLRLSCPAGPVCAGTVRLAAGGRSAGSASYALGGGTTGQLAVRLSRDARRILARRGHLALVAIASSGAPARFTARLPR